MIYNTTKEIVPITNENKLLNQLILHDMFNRGITAWVAGSKDSRKHILSALAKTVKYYNPVNNNLEQETVIWKGKLKDDWTWLPHERARIFMHHDTINPVYFQYTKFLDYNKYHAPQIFVYKTNKDLYASLLHGGINIVHEPSLYEFTERSKKMIHKHGFVNDKIISKKINPNIWWFNFIDWLYTNKNLKHMSIFIDDMEQLLPIDNSTSRLHLNLWFNDILKFITKTPISLYLAYNNYTTIGINIKSDINYYLYTNDSMLLPDSHIPESALQYLKNQNQFFIEHNNIFTRGNINTI